METVIDCTGQNIQSSAFVLTGRRCHFRGRQGAPFANEVSRDFTRMISRPPYLLSKAAKGRISKGVGALCERMFIPIVAQSKWILD